MRYNDSTVVDRNLAEPWQPIDLITIADGDLIIAQRDEEVEAHNHVVHVRGQQLCGTAAARAALVDVFDGKVGVDGLRSLVPLRD